MSKLIISKNIKIDSLLLDIHVYLENYLCAHLLKNEIECHKKYLNQTFKRNFPTDLNQAKSIQANQSTQKLQFSKILSEINHIID